MMISYVFVLHPPLKTNKSIDIHAGHPGFPLGHPKSNMSRNPHHSYSAETLQLVSRRGPQHPMPTSVMLESCRPLAIQAWPSDQQVMEGIPCPSNPSVFGPRVLWTPGRPSEQPKSTAPTITTAATVEQQHGNTIMVNNTNGSSPSTCCS